MHENKKEYACDKYAQRSFYYRKVPKVKTLVTFGFITLQISPSSEARYFQMAKTCTPNGHFKKYNRKKCERKQGQQFNHHIGNDQIIFTQLSSTRISRSIFNFKSGVLAT